MDDTVITNLSLANGLTYLWVLLYITFSRKETLFLFFFFMIAQNKKYIKQKLFSKNFDMNPCSIADKK